MTYFLLALYIPFAFWITNYIVKSRKTKRGKLVTSIASIIVFTLILSWDSLLGRAYFHYLCAKDGGSHVYEVVKLGREYWDESGAPIFIKENGELKEDIFQSRYEKKSSGVKYYRKPFNIRRYATEIIDTRTNKVIAEHVIYGFFGGWFAKYSGFDVRGVGCHSEIGFYQQFLNNIFIENDALLRSDDV